MKVSVLHECGYEYGMLGLSLSYNKGIEDMPKVAEALCRRGDEESKFLRHIDVWMLVTGPWLWWKQFMEYRLGNTMSDDWETQSSSTMHTILKGPLTQKNFERPIHLDVLNRVNAYIECKDFQSATDHLPGGFLYTREIKTNYQAIRRIIRQRCYHKLPEWREFCAQLMEQLEHQEFISDLRPVEVYP